MTFVTDDVHNEVHLVGSTPLSLRPLNKAAAVISSGDRQILPGRNGQKDVPEGNRLFPCPTGKSQDRVCGLAREGIST